MELHGKTALVTGGAVRVGRAITMALARGGANVVINYHASGAEAESAAEEARRLGVRALPVQADVADPEQVRVMFAAARQQLGGVDVLVNSASLFKKTPVPTDDVRDWQRVTRILIDGSFYCSNAAVPGMLEKGDGVIVNILDEAALEPWPEFAAHSVGKTGVMALTRQLALELAPAVRVNGVAPGPILPPPGMSPTGIAHAAQRTLLRRWGTPEDVARVVLFLIAEDYITGEVIVVDGGERWSRRQPAPKVRKPGTGTP
jgi:pteridine reductase